MAGLDTMFSGGIFSHIVLDSGVMRGFSDDHFGVRFPYEIDNDVPGLLGRIINGLVPAFRLV